VFTNEQLCVEIDNLIEKEALAPIRAFGASFTGLDVESGSGCAVRRGRRDFLLNSKGSSLF
jgi:hypothetical protein